MRNGRSSAISPSRRGWAIAFWTAPSQPATCTGAGGRPMIFIRLPWLSLISTPRQRLRHCFIMPRRPENGQEPSFGASKTTARVQLFGMRPVLTGVPGFRQGFAPMTLPVKNSPKERDSALLVAIAAGDRRALEELYLSFHRRLARFLSRFTARYENVEEIINDTFMVVWQSAKDFRRASLVSTWIFGIAYRTALKSVRRQKNHAAALGLDECPEQAVNPALDTEIQDWLAQGLEKLPLEQRLTLELAYNMGY